MKFRIKVIRVDRAITRSCQRTRDGAARSPRRQAGNV